MRNQLINILFYFLTILSFAQNSETIYPNFIGHTLNSIHNNSDWKILVKVDGEETEFSSTSQKLAKKDFKSLLDT